MVFNQATGNNKRQRKKKKKKTETQNRRGVEVLFLNNALVA